ncbi:kelch-like protein 25 [Gigantopelta aegis]|uniref:kelch-like protein 25 n=1 Tax=Gigantopelta aegis TaxID=1735272 RepID=UPI001B888616|nr:kelch-like protein 25 [Gigantopelta aegis]
MSLCSVDLVNEDNCVNMLDAGEMMQLDDVKDLCHCYLKKSLVINADNCLHWWRLMNRYNVPDLSNRAVSYLTKNLTDFIETKNIVHLSKTELLEILSNDDLKCKEDVIMKDVIKWLEANNPNADDVKRIFEMTRMDLVDPQFLIQNVVFSKFISDNNCVQQIIKNARRSEDLTTGCNSRYIFHNRRVDVFVLHWHTSLLSCFTSEGTWEDVPPAPVNPGAWYSAARLGNKIYITGGGCRRKCALVYDVCVSNLSSRLPYSSRCLRGSVHLSDIYLLDNYGNVMNVQVTDSDGEIKIQVKSTPKWKLFAYWFGVLYQNGSLLFFSGWDSNCEITKYNLAERKEQHITFPESPRSDTVFGVLPVYYEAARQ